MKTVMFCLLLGLSVPAFAVEEFAKNLERIELPPGFQIHLFAADVDNADFHITVQHRGAELPDDFTYTLVKNCFRFTFQCVFTKRNRYRG